MTKTCFVPGCQSGHKKYTENQKNLGLKCPGFYKPPRNPFYFGIWKKAIPRADRQLKHGDYVCEKHFKKEDFIVSYDTLLPDGTIYRLFRRTKILKRDAVPCIFETVPGHSTFIENNSTKTKKKCRERSTSSKKKAKTVKIANSDIEISKKNSLIDGNTSSQPVKKNSSRPAKKKDSAQTESNESLTQTEKENILLEVIYVESLPVSEKPPNQTFLTERQNEKNAKNSQNPLMSARELPTTSFPPDVSDKITEDHSNYSNCNKQISTESPTAGKPRENASNEDSAIKTTTDSFVAENNSYEGSSEKTIIHPSSPYNVKQDSTIRTTAESTEIEADSDGNDCDGNDCDMVAVECPLQDAPSDSDISDYDKTLADFSRGSEPNGNDSNKYLIGDGIAESSDVSPESFLNEQVTFETLKANVNMFETKHSWWRVNTFDDFIAFSRWSPDHTTDRKIVITKDLSVKVYLKDKETTIGKDITELTIFKITKLIYRVDHLTLCSGVSKREENHNCSGFLNSKYMCKKLNLCLNCIDWRKEEKKRALQKFRKSSKYIELLNFNLVA